MLSVSQYDISDITDTQTIYQNRSCMDFIHYFCFCITQLDHISALDDKDILFRNSQRLRDLRICF